MARQVKCDSGITGSQYKLRTAYKDFEEFERFCEIYNNHKTLGYKSPKTAWGKNPVVQSSVNPSDYRKVKDK